MPINLRLHPWEISATRGCPQESLLDPQSSQHSCQAQLISSISISCLIKRYPDKSRTLGHPELINSYLGFAISATATRRLSTALAQMSHLMRIQISLDMEYESIQVSAAKLMAETLFGDWLP
jgi:hypothetical protein